MGVVETLNLSADLSKRVDDFAAEHGLTRYDAFESILNRGLQHVLTDEEVERELRQTAAKALRGES